MKLQIAKMRLLLYATIFLSSLGMFQFGFNSSALNVPQTTIEKFFISAFKERNIGYLSQSAARTYFSIATSLFLVGGIIGALSTAWVADTLGRKRGLVYVQIVSIIGAMLGVCCKPIYSFEMLFISRFLVGFSSGMNTGLVSLYVSEISPVYMRGSAGAWCTLANVFGLLFSMVLGLTEVLGTSELWPIILGVPGFAALIQFVCLPMMPESPRYLLITKGNSEEGIRALAMFRGTPNVNSDARQILNEGRARMAKTISTEFGLFENDTETPTNEYDETYGSFADDTQNLLTEETVSVWQLLKSSQYYLALFICACIQFSQQATGFTVLLFYSTAFFQDAGLGCELSRYATIFIGGIICVMTIISIDLMERLGRRTLHVIIGLTGMLIFSVILNASLVVQSSINENSNSSSLNCNTHSSNNIDSISESASITGIVIIVSALGFVAAFGVGPGPIPWLITSEMFGQSSRAAASSLSVFWNWTAQLLVAFIFPEMQKVMGNYSLIPFTVWLSTLWIILFIYFPETKNQPAEAISRLLQIPNAWRKPIGATSVELMCTINSGRTIHERTHLLY